MRFAARQSLRLAYIAPAVAALWLLVATANFAPWASMLGAFGLVYAAPFAASRFIEADRDGRLSHVRLAGQPQMQLLASLMVGWAWPWLLLGLLALIGWMATPQFNLASALWLAAVCGGSFTLSVLALALPRGEAGADARLVAVALAAFALIASLLQHRVTNAIWESEVAGWDTLTTTSLMLLTAEAAVSAVALPRALQLVARPARPSVRRMPLVRLVPWTRYAELTRTFSLCTLPALLIGAMATALVSVLWFFVPVDPGDADWLLITFIAYAPLALCAFVLSVGARSEREGGRLDLLRLAPQRPIAVLAQVGLGATVPFLLSTAAVHGSIWMLWDRPPGGFAIALLVTAIVAPAAGVEGWLRRWPLVYTAPLAIVLIAGLLERQAMGSLWYLIAGWDRIIVLLLAWIPWACAIRVFRQPDSAPLTGWIGVAAAASVAAVSITPLSVTRPIDVLPLCAAQFVLAGFLIERRHERRLDRWGPGLASGVVSACAAGWSRQGVLPALLLALIPLTLWWMARRIHLWAPSDTLSGIIRVALALVLVSQVPYATGVFDYFAPFPAARDAAIRLAWVTRVYAVQLALVLTVTLAVEAAHHIWRRIRR